MTMPEQNTDTTRALRKRGDDNSSVRLRAAPAAGTTPDPRFVDKLIERCAIEPEFFVREMLTWALTRHPAATTVPQLIGEVRSEGTQARSQALHTLSKIGDRRAWPAITRALLSDADDEVARSAWRAAEGLGSPGAEVRRRAVQSLAGIPGDEAAALLRAASAHADPVVRRCAAPALGARGVAAAVPTLIDMVVEETDDVDAADALSALAGRPATAETIATRLVELLAPGTAGPSARRRLAEALADIPGPAASRALADLSHDEDRTVALTAAYVLGLRDAR
ncbi:MAG TPA: HEAT repeat domain-containing protein [Streptomyces sp.]|uniref:HEAT repeat domain-containing protein n=1 Tax=Streptomyces sp. TaxID=1931 RepID=UPI002BB4F1B6|nr:HEAT repeat domain-containing protein [Streptomyces sp.]HWU09463.1 HEAT repeat domain-containing protein [Streptomyces sp.]